MSRQARRDTAPELALRRAVHRRGLRYRVAFPVPGLGRRTIDMAFTRRKVAVSVLGCFWHGCPLHGTSPRANAEWWQQKIGRNKQRDKDTRRHLEGLGWTVLEIWEHEPLDDALGRVLQVVQQSTVTGAAPLRTTDR